MSVMYFLAPFERHKWIEASNINEINSLSNLHINPTDYAKALSEHWPSIKFVKVKQDHDADFALTWELPEYQKGYAGLRGELYFNLPVVSFSRASKESFVDFVIWHRIFVPAHYPLYLFDSSSPQSLEIGSSTTADVISNFVGYAAG
jgi:hypothetical protein